MRTRKTPLKLSEIQSNIDRVVRVSGGKLSIIHLFPCDYEKACRNVSELRLSTLDDGSIVKSINGRMIPVRPSE